MFEVKMDAREVLALANSVEIARQRNPDDYDVILAQRALLRLQQQMAS